MCGVPVVLKSSAEPRNDQVRANRGNETLGLSADMPCTTRSSILLAGLDGVRK